MIETGSLKDLTLQFAESFSNKDAVSIDHLMHDDFSLFDPSHKWIRGEKCYSGCI